LLQRAYLHARSLRAAWAERFGLSRSDPRYLDATEDDVVFDLLVAQYRAGDRRRLDPLESQLDNVMRDPAATAVDEAAFLESFHAGTLGERVRAFERARSDQGDTPQPIRIRAPRRTPIA
jgi:hypothetical protein